MSNSGLKHAAPAVDDRGRPGIGAWLRAEPGEWGAFGWSFACFFALLTGYYMMRPVRDAMGAVGRLELLFTGTFVCMLLIVPLYGAIVSRYPRRTFLPIVYGFFILCLAAFHFAFHASWEYRGPVFFVWVAVFNLFTVSVFWSFMSDVFAHEQAKRLYGGIAAGGTVGGFLGPLITTQLVERIGVANLLLLSAALLGVCLACILKLAPYARRRERVTGDDGERAMGGSVLAGIRLIRDSKLLQAFSLLMFFGVGVGTLLYNAQAGITREAFLDAAERTAYYARIDLAINALTIVVQIGVTRWLMTRFGVGLTLLLPGLFVIVGYCLLAVSPLPLMVALVQIVTRSGEFSLAKPARESIYTRVDREMRYKAKNFIDTVVYRGGDLSFAWIYKGLTAIGASAAAVFGLGIAVAAGGLLSVLWLIRLLRDLPPEQRAGGEQD